MNSHLQVLKPLVLAAVFVSLLGGCASTSVFRSYPSQAKLIKEQIETKQFALASEKLDKRRGSADKILYLLERGRTVQIANDNDASIEDYQQAKDAISALEQKAVISAKDTATKTAALFANDNAIPYTSEPYERIFLYQFQAMNYLFSGDLDGALVEVRRANEEQQLAFHKHEKAIIKSQEKNKGVLDENKSFMDAFKDFADIANRVENSYQNAYTFYASGVIWEIEGKPNDAYIDYKKALEIFPDNTYLQKDVVRLAKLLAMKSDLARFRKQFKTKNTKPVKKGGELIVFFEHGFVPAKQEVKVPLVTHYGVSSVAFPSYAPTWNLTPPLLIRDTSNNTLMGSTNPIVYVQALAAQALREDLPGIMVRQVLRVVAKKESADQVEKNLGTGGAVATAIFNYATERADLRSWLTLPNDAQIYRNTLAKGEYDLKLTNGLASDSVSIKIVPGKKTLLRVISTGGTMHTNVIVL